MPDPQRAPMTPGIREGYDLWSRVYDHDLNPLQTLEEPILRGLIGDVAGLEVLDLGCGTGRHSLWLADRGAKVTAVDFSEGMLAEARRKPGAEDVRFVVHDLHESLPFAAASFDRVVSGLVLEHLEHLGGFLGEARRVLRPEALAFISAMHPAMFLRGTQAQFTDPDSGGRIRPGSYPHQLSDFVMAALRAGFAIRDLREDSPNGDFATRFPRAEKYVGWPMVVTMVLRA
jgi:ubiquinone/menaquinone biosynthesis C-methylase UbiE